MCFIGVSLESIHFPFRSSPLGVGSWRGSVGVARSAEGYRRNSRETLELRISAEIDEAESNRRTKIRDEED